MDPASIFMGISAVASLASGTVGYLGAQRQAAEMEQQAKQAPLLAANRAQIQRNNAIAQAQDEQFQAGVARFNKQEALLQTDRKLSYMEDKKEATLAAMKAKSVRTGAFDYSFDDILRSEAMLVEEEEADLLYQGGMSGFQSSKSAELAGMRAGRSIEMGRYSSALSLAEGRYQASALKNQASATRIGGIGTLVGGVAQGALTASQIEWS